jgi:uncharacterized protein GlcG (DUF336 family)
LVARQIEGLPLHDIADAIASNRTAPDMKLDIAQKIIAAALAHSRKSNFKPLSLALLDARGAVKIILAEDGTSLKRSEIAHGKAHGAIALGMGSRAIQARAETMPTFVAAVSHVVGGALIPVAGGVLIKDAQGQLLGALGVSGDTSDNDEAAAVAGVKAAGLVPETGA